MKSSFAAGSRSAPATLPTVQGGGLRMRSHLALLITIVLVPMVIFSAVMMFMQIQQARSTATRLLENMAEEAAER